MALADWRGAVLSTAAVYLLAAMSPLCALERPARGQVEKYERDGTLAARAAMARSLGNHRVPPGSRERLLARLGSAATSPRGIRTQSASGGAAGLPRAWGSLPALGTVKILVLLIAFPDYPPVTAPDVIRASLFGDGSGVPPYDSLRNFYLRSSYGQLTVTGDVLGWYQAPRERSAVRETASGREGLIENALEFYDSQGHDFSQYDNDGDGTIDHLCVIWTGPPGEWASFWWGYYAAFSDTNFSLDGKRFANYSWQWELEKYPEGSFDPRVTIHETGHALGVPDYYDYDVGTGPKGGLGGLDIMDVAGDHNCFSKFMLGWITPTVVREGSQTVELRPSGTFPDAALFMPGAVAGQPFDEFFMVQYRDLSGNDAGLFTQGEGLLIWHIDARLDSRGWDFIFDNASTPHKLIRLMEADGLEEIESGAKPADAGDYYGPGMTFGPATTPNSDRYDGRPTAMTLTAEGGRAAFMRASIAIDDAPPTASITDPAPGQVVSGTIIVDTAATDASGLAGSEFYVDGVMNQVSRSAPYSFALDTALFENGSHLLKVVVRDSIGLSAEAAVAIVFDNGLPGAGLAGGRRAAEGRPVWVKSGASGGSPTVSIRDLAAGQVVSGRVEFAAAATADGGLDRVELYADNILVQTASSAPFVFSLDTAVLSSGTHTILAVAYDPAGRTGEARVDIVVRSGEDRERGRTRTVR